MTEMAAPGETVATVAADDVTFGSDHLAFHETGDIGPETCDVTGELVPDRHRGRDRRLSPLIPLVDVEIGPADARGMHLDQHLVGPRFGHGHVFEAQTLLVGVLDQRSHDW